MPNFRYSSLLDSIPKKDNPTKTVCTPTKIIGTPTKTIGLPT